MVGLADARGLKSRRSDRMTTIAWDGKTLACDSGAWRGNLVDTAKKLHHLGKIAVDHESKPVEAWAVTIGEIAYSNQLLRWLIERDEKPPVPPEKHSENFAFIVTKTLRTFTLTGNGTLGELTTVPVAAGGGAGVALGAMLHGASAVRAIEYAAERTDCAMLPVQSVRIG